MVGKWYVVEYVESGRHEYAEGIERLSALTGLSPKTAKTYLYRGQGTAPRQAKHPETKRVELITFRAVDMTEPLPDELKDYIAATA